MIKKTLLIIAFSILTSFSLFVQFSAVRAASTQSQESQQARAFFDLFKIMFFSSGEISDQPLPSDSDQDTLSNSNPSTATTVRNLREIFEDVEQKVQIPAKIVEGTLVVESPSTFNFSEDEIQSYSQPGAVIPGCRPNACSAVGPMQMTTGIDNNGSSRCGGCGLNQCPNAWSGYGNSVNTYGGYGHSSSPCNLRDSIYAGAAKLKKDSGNVGGPWTQEQVYRAARSYYGSCSDNYRYQRLGGRTYCEFLWWYYTSK